MLFLSIGILISGLLLNYYLNNRLRTETLSIEAPLVHYIADTSEHLNLQQIIHQAQKNVVQIDVSTPSSNRTGSGFLYNNLGDIVTNAHVIENATHIDVVLSSTETFPAAIVGYSETEDIAVIRVPQLVNQRPLDIDRLNKLTVGTEIVAVGSPLGLQNSVSVGIISGIDRTFEINGYDYEQVYQISSNITHGNSGGPLIDRETGKVVGINSAGITNSDIGFSIPIYAVIDTLTTWSLETPNSALTFPTSSTRTSYQIEDYEADSFYLIQYFVDSLAINDYINAYMLLGNDIQETMSYVQFREKYTAIKHLALDENYEVSSEGDRLLFQVEIEKEMTNQSKSTSSLQFDLGFENDQLKILSYE